MDNLLTWGAVIGAGGSLVAIAKFWMDMGTTKTMANSAHAAAIAASAKADLTTMHLSEHKIEAAREFATVKELAAAETRFASSIDGIRSDIRGFADRLDKLLVELIHKRDSD